MTKTLNWACLVLFLTFKKFCLLSLFTNREMQVIYTSSYRGKGNAQSVSNLYRMDNLDKNKTLQNKGQWWASLHSEHAVCPKR